MTEWKEVKLDDYKPEQVIAMFELRDRNCYRSCCGEYLIIMQGIVIEINNEK